MLCVTNSREVYIDNSKNIDILCLAIGFLYFGDGLRSIKKRLW